VNDKDQAITPSADGNTSARSEPTPRPENIDRELQDFGHQFDPEQYERPKSQWPWLVGGAILLIVATVAVTLGRLRPLSPSPGSQTPQRQMTSVSLSVAGVIGEKVVILAGGDGQYSSIQVADTSPQAIQVLNLTRGRFATNAAMLSPQKDRLAYIRDEAGRRTAEVITITNSISVGLSEKELSDANGGVPLAPCAWSPIVWSPNGKRFAFFGCGNNLSALVCVDGTDKLTPIVLKQTDAAAVARQVFWLDDDSLLYTSYDPTTGQAKVHRVAAVAGAAPLLVYGN